MLSEKLEESFRFDGQLTRHIQVAEIEANRLRVQTKVDYAGEKGLAPNLLRYELERLGRVDAEHAA